MSVAEDLREYAGKRWPTMNHKGRKRELQRLLKVGARRIKSLYEAEQTAVPRGEEMARIAALIEEPKVAESRVEYRALEARLAHLEALLQTVHAEFYQPHVDALREQARGAFAVARGPGSVAQNGGAADGPED